MIALPPFFSIRKISLITCRSPSTCSMVLMLITWSNVASLKLVDRASILASQPGFRSIPNTCHLFPKSLMACASPDQAEPMSSSVASLPDDTSLLATKSYSTSLSDVTPASKLCTSKMSFLAAKSEYTGTSSPVRLLFLYLATCMIFFCCSSAIAFVTSDMLAPSCRYSEYWSAGDFFRMAIMRFCSKQRYYKKYAFIFSKKKLVVVVWLAPCHYRFLCFDPCQAIFNFRLELGFCKPGRGSAPAKNYANCNCFSYHIE